MKKYVIKAEKTYEKNGETKRLWLPVGTLSISESGSIFVELNANPTQKYMAFPIEEQRGANESTKVEDIVVEAPSDSVRLEDIPF